LQRSSANAPILIYDRLAANRRKSRWLLIILGVVSTPVFLFVAHYLTAIVAMMTMSSFTQAASSPEAAIAPILGISTTIAVLVMVATARLYYRYCADAVLRLTGAQPLAPKEETPFRRIVENLCIGAGLPKPQVAVIESTATNLYSTGLDPEKSTLVVTRGLLQALDRRELEGVVAQELSQIGNGDVRLGTILATVVMIMLLPYILVGRAFKLLYRANRGCGFGCLILILYLVGLAVVSVIAGMGMLVEPSADHTTRLLLLAVMLLPLYALVVGPAIGYLLRFAVSREREFLADADAALLTRYPPGLARALAKIGVPGNAAIDSQASIAHLWIVDPRRAKSGQWTAIFATHPPLGERIDALARMGGTTPEMLQEAEMAGRQYRDAVGLQSRS
jgi:heat shock protein HtpX